MRCDWKGYRQNRGYGQGSTPSASPDAWKLKAIAFKLRGNLVYTKHEDGKKVWANEMPFCWINDGVDYYPIRLVRRVPHPIVPLLLTR